MRLLVTGAAGYLGSELAARAERLGHEVLAGKLRSEPPHGRPLPLDLRDADAVQAAFRRHRPEVVVHTAYRQAEELLRDDVVGASRNVAAAASASGARLLHLSTDLVFDGERAGSYREKDEARPVSAYGAAKLEAERLVAELDPGALIVRTSLLYGKREPGPQERLALQEIAFYTDEIRCPTVVGELADALLELAALDVSGLLHVVAPEAVSRYELAPRLRAAQGGDPDTVRGEPSPPGGRARNVALDASRAATLLETPLRGLSIALRQL